MSIWWIRRDLRLQDNPALGQACADGAVLPVFVFDTALWDAAGPVRRAYLVNSLQLLNESMAGHLIVRYGDPVHVIPELAAEISAPSVHIGADYGPYGSMRDQQVEIALTKAGRSLIRTGSPYAVAPGRVTKADGTPVVRRPRSRQRTATRRISVGLPSARRRISCPPTLA